MSKFEQKKLSDILNKSPFSLGKLRHKITEISQINQCFQRILPEEFRPHCQVANCRDHKLIVCCDSAGWATRLRFTANEILEKLHKEGLGHIQSVHGIVSPQNHVEEEEFWEIKPPPAETQATIQQIAKTIEDEELKAALLRLFKEK